MHWNIIITLNSVIMRVMYSICTGSIRNGTVRFKPQPGYNRISPNSSYKQYNEVAVYQQHFCEMYTGFVINFVICGIFVSYMVCYFIGLESKSWCEWALRNIKLICIPGKYCAWNSNKVVLVAWKRYSWRKKKQQRNEILCFDLHNLQVFYTSI